MVASQTRNRKRKSVPTGSLEVLFTSHSIKGIVLFLIIAFNILVLKNSFLLALPESRFTGDAQIDAIFYGIAIAILMVIILFHEKNWNNMFCPGAITLYLNTTVLILYLRWFDWALGHWWTLWALSGTLILLPVMGLFIVVIMLKS